MNHVKKINITNNKNMKLIFKLYKKIAQTNKFHLTKK